MRQLIAPLVALALGGCAVLSTQPLIDRNDGGRRNVGLHYSLAKALILVRVRVHEPSARFIVCVSAEIPIEDHDHQYVLTHRNSPFSADKFTVDTHPGTGVLKQIEAKAIDQTDQFVIELAKSIGSIKGSKESADALGECSSARAATIANVHMDPGDSGDVAQKLRLVNEVALRFARTRVEKCKDLLSASACREYQRVVASARGGHPIISMVWQRPRAETAPAAPDYCAVGVCYRARLPYMLNISVAGATVDSFAFSLPNNSPLVAMDISRGIAITKTTKIVFDRLGQPTQIMLQKGNDDGVDGAEAVELAKLPAAVISAYFDSVTSTVGKLSTAITGNASLLQAKTSLLEKQNAFAAAARKEAGEQTDTINFVIAADNGVAREEAKLGGAPVAPVEPAKENATRPEQPRGFPPLAPGR